LTAATSVLVRREVPSVSSAIWFVIFFVCAGVVLEIGYVAVRLSHPAGHHEPVPGATHDGEPPWRGDRRHQRRW
jgi:hypothetical protein